VICSLTRYLGEWRRSSSWAPILLPVYSIHLDLHVMSYRYRGLSIASQGPSCFRSGRSCHPLLLVLFSTVFDLGASHHCRNQTKSAIISRTLENTHSRYSLDNNCPFDIRRVPVV